VVSVLSLTPQLAPAPTDWQAEVWRLLGEVNDPEIPILSIIDLGIVRYVRGESREALHVGLTPTYSGCPATEVIRRSVEEKLARAGFGRVVIETLLAPPWTSDWITPAARLKLAAYGIAPPEEAVSNPRRLFATAPVGCPRCKSTKTRLISEFGSTPCKAHYMCAECLEPFDYFKCI
jgi:ring-1,2-phenylacetyl-CoA epoxidase subunit PaaD